MARNKRKNYLGDNINGASFDSILSFANNNPEVSESYYKIIKKSIPLEDVEDDVEVNEEIANQLEVQLDFNNEVLSEINETRRGIELIDFTRQTITELTLPVLSLPFDSYDLPPKLHNSVEVICLESWLLPKVGDFFDEKTSYPVDLGIFNTTLGQCISNILILQQLNEEERGSALSYSLKQYPNSGYVLKERKIKEFKLTKRILQLTNFKFENCKEKPFT